MITLSHLHQIYRKEGKEIVALSDVSLVIHKGDFVVIMGKSGSGKSTLLHILGCLQRVQKGEYRFDGLKIHQLNEKQLTEMRKEKIGFVFQQFHLIPYLTAKENIEIARGYLGKMDEERIWRLLKLVKMEERANHLPNELSGGQCQRIAIGRAMANQPKILLCDEPTGALDEESAKWVIRILKELNRYGITIVLVTHDRTYRNVGNRLFYVEEGRVMECDSFSG